MQNRRFYACYPINVLLMEKQSIACFSVCSFIIFKKSVNLSNVLHEQHCFSCTGQTFSCARTKIFFLRSLSYMYKEIFWIFQSSLKSIPVTEKYAKMAEKCAKMTEIGSKRYKEEKLTFF